MAVFYQEVVKQQPRAVDFGAVHLSTTMQIASAYDEIQVYDMSIDYPGHSALVTAERSRSTPECEMRLQGHAVCRVVQSEA